MGDEGLVMGEHERGLVDVCNNIRHRKGLARAGNSEHCLLFQSRLNARGQTGYCLGLISRRRICTFQLKLVHSDSPPCVLVLGINYTTG